MVSTATGVARRFWPLNDDVSKLLGVAAWARSRVRILRTDIMHSILISETDAAHVFV